MFTAKRIYDSFSQSEGKRYLVDRVWPRGVSKEAAALDGWLKDLAPSTELREWFNHEPAKWDEFKRRYKQELTAPETAELMARLRREAHQEAVILLFAAKDTLHNNAVALKEFLDKDHL